MPGTNDIDNISKSVLCNQFVAGLLEGNFDTLITKARIEQVKFRELGKSEPAPSRQ